MACLKFSRRAWRRPENSGSRSSVAVDIVRTELTSGGFSTVGSVTGAMIAFSCSRRSRRLGWDPVWHSSHA